LEGGYARILGLKNFHFPFDRQRWNIDAEKAAELIARERPRLVILGASFIPFPHPTEQISKVCLETGSMLAYDGSHVLGLIAGGAFQQPLKEGARVLVGSTHKSLFGPQGGIITSFGPEGERIKQTIFPAIVDNAHWNRIAALAQALLEVRRFGSRYARQVIRNSRALAEALDDAGVPVRCREYGYTASHQVLLDMDRLKDANEIPRRLQEANIIVDIGIRLGTSEVTRRGMREKEMNAIADMIGGVISGRENPKKAKKRAITLARRFSRVRYA
jgi:glycine hydroxymethyltransferase